MRTYQEPIEVLFRDGPVRFLWRGRVLQVVEVQALTRRSSPWWAGHRVRAARGEEVAYDGDLLREREIWRVEATGGRLGPGVYELARTVGGRDWVLQAVSD